MDDIANGIFAAAELGNTVDKRTYSAEVETLRVELLNLQFDLKEQDFSVVILLAGDDRPGAIAAARRLHEWIDSRHIETNIMFEGGSAEEEQRPVLWRYWSRLPRDGRISLFLGAWPTLLVTTALAEDWDSQRIETIIEHMARFERELTRDGTLVLKFWFHLPRDEHEARLADAAQHPERYWQFEQRDWEILKNYKPGLAIVEQVLRGTNTPEAPWFIVESTDQQFRDLTLGRTLAAALKSRLETTGSASESPAHVLETPGGLNLLSQIDLSAVADSQEYSERLIALQSRLNELSRAANFAKIASVVAFEGVDAAGKGGTIRRITAAVPIQSVRVIPVAAPSEEERLRHYLWRFWRHLPAAGDMTIFDRSWYGRVLVERVEGIAGVDAWSRAYEEINDFEAMLVQSGMPVVKFWLQIDAEEQLRRFEARAQTPYKKYKLTDEDFRNREKWDLYQQAAHDMVARTNTSHAPWQLLAANDKKHARLRALEILCDALETRLIAVLGDNWRKKVPDGAPAGSKKMKKDKKKSGKT
jgi:polyphosphate:AMP phosphotransferase